MYIRVVPHAQDASHHQDYYICLGSGIGDPYKPLIASITGRGGQPKVIYQVGAVMPSQQR